MPTDPQDLKRRLAAATDADTTRGLNFNTVFSLVGEELGDAAAKDCDPLRRGSRVDFFSYPIQDYLRITWAAVDRLEQRLGGVEPVFKELGRRTISGFLTSVLGRTVFAVAGRDPRRVLAAGPGGYRSAVSYGERHVEWVGDKQARMVFRRDFMPFAFHVGVIEAALLATDAVAPSVAGRETGFLETEYDIHWG
jgi:uncharacterized protein (TIGR02265 family)